MSELRDPLYDEFRDRLTEKTLVLPWTPEWIGSDIKLYDEVEKLYGRWALRSISRGDVWEILDLVVRMCFFWNATPDGESCRYLKMMAEITSYNRHDHVNYIVLTRPESWACTKVFIEDWRFDKLSLPEQVAVQAWYDFLWVPTGLHESIGVEKFEEAVRATRLALSVSRYGMDDVLRLGVRGVVLMNAMGKPEGLDRESFDVKDERDVEARLFVDAYYALTDSPFEWTISNVIKKVIERITNG